MLVVGCVSIKVVVGVFFLCVFPSRLVFHCFPKVVAMTGDCMGDLESPPDCAADITSFMEPWQG